MNRELKNYFTALLLMTTIIAAIATGFIASWPSPEEIEKFQAQNPINRAWSCFDYSNCKHDCSTINYAGDYEIESCIDCGFSASRCCHKYNSWSPDEKLLRCKTCGMDVT